MPGRTFDNTAVVVAVVVVVFEWELVVVIGAVVVVAAVAFVVASLWAIDLAGQLSAERGLLVLLLGQSFYNIAAAAVGVAVVVVFGKALVVVAVGVVVAFSLAFVGS